jgi:PAS domain S-box-containing protein
VKGKSSDSVERQASAGDGETLADVRILDRLPDAVVCVRRDGRVVWANQVYQERFGRSGEAVIGVPAIEALMGPLAEQVDGTRLVQQISAGMGDLELVALSSDGVSYPVLARITPLDSQRRLLTLTDVSEIHRLRAELVGRYDASRAERRLLKALGSVVTDAIFLTDESQRLVLANAAARALLNGAGDSYQGLPVADIGLPPAIRGAWLAFLSGVEETDQRRVTARFETGCRNIELRMVQVRPTVGHGGGSILVIRPVPDDGAVCRNSPK